MTRVGTWGPGRVFALVFVLYVSGSAISWWMIRTSDLGAVFFPPAGITLIAFLSLPATRWPAIAAAIVTGEFAAGYTVGDADDLLATGGYAAANVAEPLVATLLIARLLRRPAGSPLRPDLARSRDLLILGAAGVAVAPVVGAAIGSFVTWWRTDLPPSELAPQWLLGDALAVAIVAPLCLAWQASPGPRPLRPPRAALVVGSATVLTAAVLAATDLPFLFVVLIGLVVVGALLDVRVLAMTAAAITVTAGVAFAIDPEGLIGGLAPTTALWVTKLELLCFVVIAYAVAAEVHDRADASIHALRQAATVGELQRLLLPPSSLSGPGFRAVGVYEAAHRDVGVGGDWYLVRRLADGRIIIGVGDIVGHDIDAARTMAAVRSGLLLEAAIDPSPHALLARLDRFAAVEPSIRYGSAWLGWFDPTTRTLEYACGGHLPPLLVSGAGVERLEESNTALIGLPQGPRRAATVAVPPDACLVLYTDGLIERRLDSIDDGIDRLADLVPVHRLDPRSIVDELLVDSVRHDDSILVMIELGEPAGPSDDAAAASADPSVEVESTRR